MANKQERKSIWDIEDNPQKVTLANIIEKEYHLKRFRDEQELCGLFYESLQEASKKDERSADEPQGPQMD